MIKQQKFIAKLSFILYAFLGLCLLPSLSAASQADTQDTLMTACSPDTPLAFPGESIILHAKASSSESEATKYLWRVDTGAIRGEGAEVSWDLAGVSPGTYRAEVHVTGQLSAFAECRLTVTVGLPPLDLMSGGYETGRSILLPGEEEDKGYGLYSYLLLGSEPDDTNHQRYLQAIIEYLKFPDVKRLQKYGITSEELNITYLPLETPLERKYLRELKARNYDTYPEIAAWILKHYDYPRARALLITLPHDHPTGPYIVSFLKPLGMNPLEPPYLYVNISAIPPDLVKIWMKYFLNQAAQERYWDEDSAKLLVLKLRTLIGVTAAGLPDVMKALEDWIAWIDNVG